ncbi:NUDIX hydrolase [Actinophytocola sediminis]
MSHVRLAGCVIRDDQDRVLLLHRNTAKRTHWEIPGGKLDPGEDASTTAVRELREEMGIEVNLERELGEQQFDEDGRTMVYTWFLATIASGEPTVRERAVHDRFEYLSMAILEDMLDELSPNTRNFLNEYRRGHITL